MTTSRLLLALALTVLIAPAHAQKSSDSNLLDGLEIILEYERDTADDDLNPATVTIRPSDPDGPPIDYFLMSASLRPDDRSAIRLRQNEDGSYTGSGMLPPPGKARTVKLGSGERSTSLRMEGIGEGRNRATVAGAEGQTTSLSAEGTFSCCPLEIVIVISTG